MQRARAAAILGVLVGLTPFTRVSASPYTTTRPKSEVPAVTPGASEPANSERPTEVVAPTTATSAKSERTYEVGTPSAATSAKPVAAVEPEPMPPGPPRQKPLEGGGRRWIRQAPLAGAEPSWGPPGQVPEFAELSGPEPDTKGPPSRGTGRIVTGAILGPLGLALAISGIVGASTKMLGDHKNLSVPMIGAGLVTTAVGTALLVDGILRRKRFEKWQAKQAKVAVVPTVAPGRYAGATLVLRF